ncbi:MAG TPA: PAS domain S-box protein [Acidimicrobiales bacterium]|nr:PAS domain S-box protein [Acidimicrobiales bacterium]
MSDAELAAAAVRAVPDAVVVVDRNGIIQLWNSGAARIFGWAEDQAVGRSLDLIVPERLRQRHWEGFHHAVATGTTRYGADSLLAVPAVRADGEQISVEFTVAFITPPGEDAAGGMVAVLRDVTERRRAERELRSRLAELEKAAEAQR